ncbi:MAG: MFS transporter [Clostridia bacterium]|nr:MFS transporter [Clostridia bacterium]
MELIDRGRGLLLSLKKYWKEPPEGRFVPFKEIAAIATGGMGVRFIVYCVSNMIISIGNVLIGNTIGITPSAMYVIYIISILSGFPLTALRANMIDNTRSMKGKYLPYILKMGIPTVLLGIGFVWAPYERMSMALKCVTVLLFNIGFQFFYNFYSDAYESLINVISPNTIERTDIYAVRSVVENFSPSIVGIFLPIAARMITGSNTLYDMRVYRFLYAPLLVAGFAVSMLVYANANERIVQPRSRVIQVRFADAFRAVARNKYFWIISLAGWIGFLEGSFAQILGWMYNYQGACSAGQYSIITAIYGNASLWPNLFGPALIRRYGKKKILIVSNLMNVFLIALMLPVIKVQGPSAIWLLLACLFANGLITALGHFIGPSLNADIRDYQQYITGERIDGMFAAVGLIGNVITLATSSVLPAIYERAGLNEATAVSLGFTSGNVYDVLYNHTYFTHICSVLIVASIVGAALNAIPFFFYNLTEAKQKAMVSVLRIRAAFEDYGNGAVDESGLDEALAIIKEAEAFSGEESVNESSFRGKERRAAREKNEKIEISRLVLAELGKFDTPGGIAAVERAKKIAEAGPGGFREHISCDIAAAKKLPKNTPEEKKIRSDAVRDAREAVLSAKAIEKYYPEGLTEYDMSKLNSLFERSDENSVAIAVTLDAMKAAREKKDAAQVKNLKAELASLRTEKKNIDTLINSETTAYSVYNRAAKPYLRAVRLLGESKNYAKAIETVNSIK